MQISLQSVVRVLFVLLLLAGGIFLLIPSSPEPSWLPSDLRDEAVQTFRRAYQREPDRFDVVSVAAELAVQRDKLELANRCFGEIPSSHALYGPSARFQQGQVLLKLDQAAAAERNFREYLELPNVEFRREAEQFLRYLLEIQLRFEERHTLLASMHASHLLTPSDALFYGYASLLRWNGEVAADRCHRFYEADPESVEIKTAWAQFLGGTGQAEAGLPIINACLAKHPLHPRAMAVKMYLLSELQEDEQLSELISKLPAPNRSDPWLMLRLRGQEALSHGDLDLSERCYRLYLENDPTLAECYIRLAEIAAKRGQPELQLKFLETSRQLALIQNRLGGAQFTSNDPAEYVTLAQQSLALGLTLQAQLMAESALQIDPQNSAAQGILKECQP